MIQENCIFCKLASKEIPTSVVYETESVMAFEDNAPIAPVHVLVVPKDHYAHIGDNVPPALMAELFEVANEVARIKGIDKSGYRLVTNCGPDAGQTVFHLHIHVIGGAKVAKEMVFDREHA